MFVPWPIPVPDDSSFPIDNIPFGIFSTKESSAKRAGVAIGDYILDLSILESYGLFPNLLQFDHDQQAPQSNGYCEKIPPSNETQLKPSSIAHSFFGRPTLNKFASLSSHTRSSVRKMIILLLSNERSALFGDLKLNKAAFCLQKEAQMHVPMQIGDFTDFMCSRTHVENCSRIANAPFPSTFLAFPPAYNGRTSSIVVSGTPIRRPKGMLRVASPSTAPTSVPSVSMNTGSAQCTPSPSNLLSASSPTLIGSVSDISSFSTSASRSNPSLPSVPGFPPEFTFRPTAKLDFELELGIFVSNALPQGQTLSPSSYPTNSPRLSSSSTYSATQGLKDLNSSSTSLDLAREHIFGFVLLNDWSARDIQSTEMMPLGPFHGKSFATTISPWVVTLDALKGAECNINEEVSRGEMRIDKLMGGLGLEAGKNMAEKEKVLMWDIDLSVNLLRNDPRSPREKAREQKGNCADGTEEQFKKNENDKLLSTSNLKHLSWSPAQMIVYQAMSGCGLRTGDLLGTGTVSSPNDGSRPAQVSSLGCLLELTSGGQIPFKTSNGDEITWLEDGDEVSLVGWVNKRNVEGKTSRIGFGECKGVVLGAL